MSAALETAFVRRVAREAGAAAVAVTGADSDERAGGRMRAAFARGDFATWRYDDAYAAKASAPKNILPGARSVICVAIPYAAEARATQAPLAGRVSNYVWSGDYHVRVRGILETIAAALDRRAGASVTRIVCDTAPLAERALAERAGLAWIGKHTNAIVPGLGSYVFLGEIVTTLELATDAPSKKTCGSCTRCVSACPTGALRGDYTIDATRCISDLTQRTDSIPLAMRALIGDWVWGCDLCQDVCPPTARAPRASDMPEASDGTDAFPDLVALLELRSAEFKRRYKRSAMGWRGAAVLRRNAAVALGNSLDRAAVAPLVRALANDPHPLVRGHAAWALGRIGSPQALAFLRARSGTEPDEGVRGEIASALRGWETIPIAAALNAGGDTQ